MATANAANAATQQAVLRLRRTFRAAPKQVYDAFTRPETLARWWGPETYTAPRVDIDLRPGGRYHFDMQSPAGEIHQLSGVYREIDPPRRLVFTWAWLDAGVAGPETLVTLEFKPHTDGTELVLTHELFATEEARDLHGQGWTSSFASLAQTLQN